jgi:hypothetical protein
MAPSAATAVHATVPARRLLLRSYSTRIALNGEGVWVAEASGSIRTKPTQSVCRLKSAHSGSGIRLTSWPTRLQFNDRNAGVRLDHEYSL